MNKRYLKWITIGAFTVIGIIIGYKLSKKLSEHEKLKEGQQVLLSIEFELLKTNTLNERNKTILALFHPSCDFCQSDALQFRKSYLKLSDLEVLWISYDAKDSIQKFSETYGLDTLPNMYFAYMDIEAMLDRYGNVKFPTFLAYNESGQLIKKWVGMTQPQEILDAYNQAN